MDLGRLVDALRAGEVVAIPTDTVYGLACAPSMPGGVERIFALKGRPEDKPLPVLAASVDDLRAVADFDERALVVARRFWPGALTLVLPRADGFTADLGAGGTGTVAVRVPQHPLARDLLTRTGPLAVTSANPSGLPPAGTAREVMEYFPALEVLDGGPGAGEPSTVLSLVGDRPEILRAGAIGPEQLLTAEEDVR